LALSLAENKSIYVGELTIAVQRAEIKIGTGVIEVDVFVVSPEKRMSDKRCEGKNHARHAAGVILMLITIALTPYMSRVKKNAYTLPFQNSVKDETRIRQRRRG
jgi:hypothetical protein